MNAKPDILLSEMPDEELVIKILEGEKRLFEVLIRKYNQRLYRIGMSILQNEEETEDAMQTAYINAFEYLGSFQHRSMFGTWLIRIMLNQCLSYKRKRKVAFTGLENIHIMNTNTPDNELANKELGHAIEQAINQLPEKYRVVFVMREIELLSVRETSEVLNIEEPNVKVRLNRAKAILRDNLNSYMQDHVYSFHLAKCDRIAAKVLRHLQIA